jgi:hypothetical protein
MTSYYGWCKISKFHKRTKKCFVFSILTIMINSHYTVILCFCGMWPLCHIRHVTYSFINMLFISTRIFDDKLLPQLPQKNIIFIKTESFVGRKTSNHACQILCSKSNCETMYHWFFLLDITMVKKMNNLNDCSAHSYLYLRSQFKRKLLTLVCCVLFCPE